MNPDNPMQHPPTHAPPAAAPLPPSVPKQLRLDMVLAGDPAGHRHSLDQLLRGNGWTTQWSSEWSGMATKGNKVMNVLFGAFAQYHEMQFQFSSNPDGTTNLHVYRMGEGCAGGLIGMHKARKTFEQSATMIEQHYASHEALLATGGH